ncbi:MAG: hypothetical protein PHQ34_06330 [Methanothrix sp.]|nr:hypothetical protein [Methanothrix sp.]
MEIGIEKAFYDILHSIKENAIEPLPMRRARSRICCLALRRISRVLARDADARARIRVPA